MDEPDGTLCKILTQPFNITLCGAMAGNMSLSSVLDNVDAFIIILKQKREYPPGKI